VKREPQIFTTIDDQNVPVGDVVLVTLEQEEIQETLLREWVRGLLTEAAKGPQDLPDGIFVKIFLDNDGYGDIAEVQYVEDDGNSVGWGSRPTPEGTPFGIVMIYKPTEKEAATAGQCEDAWMVLDSSAVPGWGPMLYDVAMEYATLNGGGLISDRGVVSNSARKVWDYYMNNRPDVTAHQLDDLENTLTPEEEDNCNQRVAGYSSVTLHAAGKPSDMDWIKSPLSKRYTAPPTMMDKLSAAGKLMES
jgi:hypothetical protein|tara:strand:+ start:1420 stop:2163 length:744 start_codon:yes stop_codon:yes gene_type:complete